MVGFPRSTRVSLFAHAAQPTVICSALLFTHISTATGFDKVSTASIGKGGAGRRSRGGKGVPILFLSKKDV